MSHDMRSAFPKVVPVLFLLFALLGSGCVPAHYRVNPELTTRTQGIRNAGFATPDVKIFEISAGGVTELRDDWSMTGQDNVRQALLGWGGRQSLQVKEVTPDKELEEDLKEVKALYQAVSYSIIVHTYNQPTLFDEKVRNFDYSLGPIDRILEKTGADCLLIVQARDNISTSGRKAMNVLSAVLTGVVMGGVTSMSAALVDRSGKILWFNVGSSVGADDLREARSAANMVTTVMVGFPRLGQ